MTYGHRIELAESFISQYCARTAYVFQEHWSSPWRGAERMVYLTTPLEEGLLGVIDIFIESSYEMGIQMSWTFGVTTVGYSKLWLKWMPNDLHPAEHALECILKADTDYRVEIQSDQDFDMAMEDAVNYTRNEMLPFMRRHGTCEALLQELADGTPSALERKVVHTAGDGELDAALHTFDQELWPAVSAKGERMVVERWRRLRNFLVPKEEQPH